MLQTRSLIVGKTYETKITLTQEALEELSWWINQIDQSNGRSIISSTPDMVIASDASNKEWVGMVVCLATRTGGVWALEEQKLHINAKELLAAFLEKIIKVKFLFT